MQLKSAPPFPILASPLIAFVAILLWPSQLLPDEGENPPLVIVDIIGYLFLSVWPENSLWRIDKHQKWKGIE